LENEFFMIQRPSRFSRSNWARSLANALDGFLSDRRCLIHDRASLFREDFRLILEAAGIESVRFDRANPEIP
jgi:hypothetical protein